MIPSRFRVQGRIPFLLLIAALVVAASVYAGVMWRAFVTSDPAASPDASATAATGFVDQVGSNSGSELVVATRVPGRATSCGSPDADDNAWFGGTLSWPSTGDASDACPELVDSLHGLDRISVHVDGGQPASVAQPGGPSVSTTRRRDSSSFPMPPSDAQGLTTRR